VEALGERVDRGLQPRAPHLGGLRLGEVRLVRVRLRVRLRVRVRVRVGVRARVRVRVSSERCACVAAGRCGHVPRSRCQVASSSAKRMRLWGCG